MTPTPVALGMTLCDQVIVEKNTEKPSIIGSFLGLPVASFPSGPQRFSIFATITDGQGKGIIEVVVAGLEHGDVIFSKSFDLLLPNPLTVCYAHVRVTTIRFPSAGFYVCELRVDGEMIAHRRFRVYQT